MLSLKEVESRLWDGKPKSKKSRPLVVCPYPDFQSMDIGTVGLDLHLGSWFAFFREANIDKVKIESDTPEEFVVKSSYVPINTSFILHPDQFVLGITLEWVKLPGNLAAHVVGKSSWGRRGLIIATATGVQPFYRGCLTLEIANVGRAPLELRPGIPICQLFFEEVNSPQTRQSRRSIFSCSRKPTVGEVGKGAILKHLSKFEKP